MRKVCWPKEWLDAAMIAGLAKVDAYGQYFIVGGDEMRDKLQAFADAITNGIEEEKEDKANH